MLEPFLPVSNEEDSPPRSSPVFDSSSAPTTQPTPTEDFDQPRRPVQTRTSTKRPDEPEKAAPSRDPAERGSRSQTATTLESSTPKPEASSPETERPTAATGPTVRQPSTDSPGPDFSLTPEERQFAEAIQEAADSSPVEAIDAPEAAEAEAPEPTEPKRAATEPRATSIRPTKPLEVDVKTSLRLEEALAAEDEAENLEVHRLEQLERSRALDEARIYAQASRESGLPGPGAGQASGGFGGDPNSRQSPGQDSRWAMLALARETTPLLRSAEPSIEGMVASTSGRSMSAPSVSPDPVHRARRAVLEQIREQAKNKSMSSGRLQLTIQLDEVNQVKLAISPRPDGTHELAFWVADPRLREELRRSIPEIRLAATELPVEVAEVFVGEHSAPSLPHGTRSPHHEDSA